MTDDPFDRELSGRLRGLGGGADDTDAALAALRPRARNARRRRQTAITGGAAAALVGLVAIGSVVVDSGTDPDGISTPATQPGVSIPSTTTTAPAPASTTTTTVDTTPTTVPGGIGGGTTPTSPSSPTTTETAPTAPAPQTETQSNDGGSVTVRLDNGVLSLVSADPAPGYTVEEQEERADRVRVRFRHPDGGDHRIEFGVAGGQIVVERNE